MVCLLSAVLAAEWCQMMVLSLSSLFSLSLSSLSSLSLLSLSLPP